MGTYFSLNHQDLISDTSLLKAKLSQHLALKYNINDMIIKSNYSKSNPSPKHEEESIHVSKKIARKIVKIHKLNAKIHQIKRHRNSNRHYPKFLNILQNNPIQTFARLQQSKEDPESMINEDLKIITRLNLKFQSLLGYITMQKDKFNQNSGKIEENAQKALNLAKSLTELNDLKHYKKYLETSQQFLLKEKIMKINERNFFIRPNSIKFSNKIYLLNKSRELIETYEEKIKDLKERNDSKMEYLMSEHEKIIENFKNSTEDFGNLNDLQKRLAAMGRKEELLREKLAFWKRQKEVVDISGSTEDFFSKEESMKKDLDKSEKVKNEDDIGRNASFEDEWTKYNLMFNKSMEFFNQITSNKGSGVRVV